MSNQAAATGRVLLVEDHELVRDLIRHAFVEAGFDVTDAARGDQAVNILYSAPRFDLLVVDWRLPGASGDHVLAAAQAISPGLPTILITGAAEMPPLVNCNRIFFKPFPIPLLVDAARELLAGPPSAPPSDARVSPDRLRASPNHILCHF